MKKFRTLMLLSMLPLLMFTQGCLIGFESWPVPGDVSLTVYASDVRGALSLDLNADGDDVCFELDQEIVIDITHNGTGRTLRRVASCTQVGVSVDGLEPGSYTINVFRRYDDGETIDEERFTVRVRAGQRTTVDLALEED
jgi:hypothetical protein